MYNKFDGSKIRHYFHYLHRLFLLNYIEKHPDGITYYQLQQIDNVPASRTYRLMNHLEELGYLNKQKEKNESGRPKYLFTISKSGRQFKVKIQNHLRDILKLLQSKYPNQMDFDIESFVKKSTITLFKSPIELILGSQMSPKEKLDCLIGLREDHRDLLEKMDHSIKKLKNEIGES